MPIILLTVGFFLTACDEKSVPSTPTPKPSPMTLEQCTKIQGALEYERDSHRARELTKIAIDRGCRWKSTNSARASQADCWIYYGAFIYADDSYDAKDAAKRGTKNGCKWIPKSEFDSYGIEKF